MLTASHDLNMAGAFADRLLLLDDGKLIADGPPSQILQPAVLEPVYGVRLIRMESDGGRAPVIAPIFSKDAIKPRIS